MSKAKMFEGYRYCSSQIENSLERYRCFSTSFHFARRIFTVRARLVWSVLLRTPSVYSLFSCSQEHENSEKKKEDKKVARRQSRFGGRKHDATSGQIERPSSLHPLRGGLTGFRSSAKGFQATVFRCSRPRARVTVSRRRRQQRCFQ